MVDVGGMFVVIGRKEYVWCCSRAWGQFRVNWNLAWVVLENSVDCWKCYGIMFVWFWIDYMCVLSCWKIMRI